MTKVSPVSDLSAFLATLGRSGLLPEDEFTRLSESLGSAGDPKTAARELLKQNKITRWQAGQLLHGYHQLVYGKYKLLDQIGSGEMGRVYLAEHGQLGRRVALKALSRKHTADPNILKAFLSDARRVGGLDHPNLCHMYDVNQEGDRYFLVMEYVDGQNLQQRMEKGPKLEIARIIEIGRHLAAGLGHAHAQKVLHGDLKPTNIVIDKNGQVKILDIGLSRLTEATAAANEIEDTTESPSLASGIYRPQEQIDGKGIDERTDWYSLGAVLCYLLTGQPFHQPEACRSVDQLKKQRPDAPAELLALCASLLAENPADRPSSAADVTAALDSAEKGLASTKPAAPAAAPAARPPLPRAKAEPAAAAPAKTDSNAGKPRKPPVARPLNDAPAAPADTVAGSTADTFSFDFNSGAAPAAKKPPIKKGPPKASAAAADSGAISLSGISTQGSSKSGSGPKASAADPATVEAPKPKSKLPLIIGGAIGGGVLLLALVAGLAFMFLGGGDEEIVAKADGGVESAAAEADSADTSDSGEANPEEANPVEANPVAATVEESNPAEANPVVDETTDAPSDEAGAAPPASSEGSGAMPADDAAPMPSDAPSEPASTEPAEAPPADEPKPPEPKPAPKAEAPKPAPPKAAPPKPAGNPFAGFAKAVSLPKPPAGMTEPTAELLAPVTLGPCKVDERALIIVRLLGGETALKGGRQKFTLDAAENGTAERDWEIRCGTDNESEVVALVSVKDQAVTFQWTPEGAKNSASPYLSNCMMEFNAGVGHHQCALRETVAAEPLVVELDKPNTGAKWNLDALPDERQMEVEVVAVQSGAPKSRIENNTLTADKPSTNVLLGTADDKLPLAIELKMSATAKQVEVRAVPKLKLEGLPPGKDRYNKKMVQTLVSSTAAALQGAEQRHMVANQIKNADQKKKALAQAEIYKTEVAKANDLVQALQSTAQAVETSTVHFRVWYLADTGKVLLLDTGGPPPPAAKK